MPATALGDALVYYISGGVAMEPVVGSNVGAFDDEEAATMPRLEQRRAQAALTAGEGDTGYHVPRSRPAGFDSWPIFKQKGMDARRKTAEAHKHAEIEESPRDFDDWPYLLSNRCFYKATQKNSNEARGGSHNITLAGYRLHVSARRR